MHQINTRHHATLHQPSVNVTKYQKGVHCIGIKMFNMLPFYIKVESDNSKKYKALLQKYLALSTSLCKSYYMIKSLKNIRSIKMVWNTYFAYVESRLRYGIMFWGSDGKSIRIFRLQKKVINLITGTHKRKSCRPIFRKYKILTLISLYIFEMLCFFKNV